MAYSRSYRAVVPVEHGIDHETARWLARESFEKRATSDCLHIADEDYTERQMSIDEIPPKAMKQLGRPLTDFDWYEFTAVARLNQVLFDWCAAECAWKTSQAKEHSAQTV